MTTTQAEMSQSPIDGLGGARGWGEGGGEALGYLQGQQGTLTHCPQIGTNGCSHPLLK